MTGRRCTRCGNRLRIRSRTCRHCGRPEHPAAAGAAARRGPRRIVGLGLGALLVAGVLLFVGQRMVTPAAIADWYAEFAMQRLPQFFSGFAPAESSMGAFYFCIRRVVKDEMDARSVATFPSANGRTLVELGEGLYRIETFVDEDRADGSRVRREFSCTTRYERNRWVLEELRMNGEVRLAG